VPESATDMPVTVN